MYRGYDGYGGMPYNGNDADVNPLAGTVSDIGKVKKPISVGYDGYLSCALLLSGVVQVCEDACACTSSALHGYVL